MKNFVPVFNSPNQMQAELVRNQIEQSGLPASLEWNEQTRAYEVFVNSEDRGAAEKVLETSEALPAESPEASDLSEDQNRQAEKEFREMKQAAVMRRARGEKGAFQRMLLFFIGGAIVCAIYFQRSFLFRLGLALLFLGVVDLFVWRDAVKARRELESQGTSE